ncbi:uncharacterized protein [Dysidea avara]|uniref:uncharacterized protein n=1 Tax=Dysidea avara TaxID=196820 RepID=UPI003318C832
MAGNNRACSPGKVGVALIFSNDYKDTPNRDLLSGTVEDARRMKQAFTFLGYEVIVRQNVKKEDLMSECVKLRSYDYSPANGCKRIAVVFSGHGQDGELILQDNSTINVADLVDAFKPRANRTLVNTIRMFFIDACRGGKSDPGISLVSRSPKGGSFIERLSSEAGVIVAYSTTKHHKAYENASGGLWMKLLAHEMCTCNEGLLSILVNANKKLTEYCGRLPKEYAIQTAEFTNSLIENVYFLKERPNNMPEEQYSIPQHPMLAMQFPNPPFIHHVNPATPDQLPLDHPAAAAAVDPQPSFTQQAFMTATNQPPAMTVSPQLASIDALVLTATSTSNSDEAMDTTTGSSQSHLREVLTAQGITCQYQITETPSGMDGRPWYSCELNCHSNGVTYKFRSRQSYRDRDEAKQDVNKQALAEPNIGHSEIFSRSVVESYQEKLLAYCSKKGYRSPSYSAQTHSNGYVSSVLVPRNGKFEGEVAADLAKAKESAAKQALRDLGEIHFVTEII